MTGKSNPSKPCPSTASKASSPRRSPHAARLPQEHQADAFDNCWRKDWQDKEAYRADVNADLASGYERVLIIPPLGDKTRKPLDWGLHLTAQVYELRAAGSTVETIFPDRDSQSALGFGMSLMDLSARRPSAEAGYNQGKAVAEHLADFWRL